jgi:hypothetical protein
MSLFSENILCFGSTISGRHTGVPVYFLPFIPYFISGEKRYG